MARLFGHPGVEPGHRLGRRRHHLAAQPDTGTDQVGAGQAQGRQQVGDDAVRAAVAPRDDLCDRAVVARVSSPSRPAAASRSVGRASSRPGVRTTPTPGSQTSHRTVPRQEPDWAVTTALPSTVKKPSAPRSRRGTGRAASRVTASS